MIEPYNYEQDYCNCNKEPKHCKKEKKTCCIDIVLAILLGALLFTVGLLVGGLTSIIILLSLPAIIVLIAILLLLFILRIIMLICNKKC